MGGNINARMWRMGQDKSALQALGSHSNHQDSRGRVNGNKVRLAEEILLPVGTGIRLCSVSPKFTPQGASAGPRGKDNIAINNPRTGGSPRPLDPQQVDAELADLPPNQRRPPRKEPTAGTAVTKSADIERAKMNTGKDMRAAMVLHNINSGMLDKIAGHNTRASLRENERPVTHRGVSTARLRGHTMQPLPRHTATTDQQAGDIIRERGNNTSSGPLGKPVRKLFARVTFMGPNVLKANISDLIGNEQHGRSEASKLGMASKTPKRFSNIR